MPKRQNNIKVSVIIPVYDAEKYLRQCLDTVVNQTLKDIEIILIDDGSTDNSLSICREYAKKDKRIQVYTQKNCGAGATRNRGIEIAKGEYLSFLDADDFFELDMLEKMYSMAKKTDSDITFCDHWLLDELTERIVKKRYSLFKDMLPKKKTFSAKDCPQTLFQIIPMIIWVQLYRRSFILQNGLKFQNLANSNDVYFSMVARAVAKRQSYLYEKLVYHRRHPTSTVSNREKDWKAAFKAICSVEDFLKRKKLYDMLQVSFLRNAFDALNVCRTLREPILNSWKRCMCDTIIPRFFFKNIHMLLPYQVSSIKDLQCKRNLSPLLEKLYNNSPLKIIPIVISSGESPLDISVTIESILKNSSSSYFYDIYIPFLNLAKGMRDRLESLTKSNIRVTCLDLKKRFYNTADESLIYNGYNICCLLPKLFYGYKKAICLMSDIVIKCDIAKFYKVNMGNTLLINFSAPIDLIKTKTSKLSDKNIFFIMNLENSKTDNIIQKYIDVLKTKPYQQTDILNLFSNQSLLKSGTVEINDFSEKYSPTWWYYARKSPFYESILFQRVNYEKNSS